MFHALFVIFASFGGAFSSAPTPTCRNANFQTDEAIAACDYLMKLQGGAYWLDDFHTDLYPSVFGVRIPIEMALEGANGILKPLNSLRRLGKSTGCSTDSYERVETSLKYDGLLSEYDFNVRFLFWKAAGTLVFMTAPLLNATIKNGADACVLESFDLTDPGLIDYQITSDASWISRILTYWLHRTLVVKDTTPMLSLMSNKLESFINVHFRDAWCTLHRLGVIN